MGRGYSGGRVSDYYKRHGQGGKRGITARKRNSTNKGDLTYNVPKKRKKSR